LQQLKTNGAPKAAVTYYEKIVPLAYRLGPCGLFGLVKRIVFNVQGLKEPTPREPKSLADMRVWAHKSAALAAENFMLAIRAQGFDTCPMEGFDSARVRALLGLRCRAEINMVIAIGRRGKGGIYGPQTRLPRENFVFEV
jgi:nitroreductase